MRLRVCTWILHLFPSVFYSLLEYVSFLTHSVSFLLSFLDYPCSPPVLCVNCALLLNSTCTAFSRSFGKGLTEMKQEQELSSLSCWSKEYRG